MDPARFFISYKSGKIHNRLPFKNYMVVAIRVWPYLREICTRTSEAISKDRRCMVDWGGRPTLQTPRCRFLVEWPIRRTLSGRVQIPAGSWTASVRPHHPPSLSPSRPTPARWLRGGFAGVEQDIWRVIGTSRELLKLPSISTQCPQYFKKELWEEESRAWQLSKDFTTLPNLWLILPKNWKSWCWLFLNREKQKKYSTYISIFIYISHIIQIFCKYFCTIFSTFITRSSI